MNNQSQVKKTPQNVRQPGKELDEAMQALEEAPSSEIRKETSDKRSTKNDGSKASSSDSNQKRSCKFMWCSDALGWIFLPVLRQRQFCDFSKNAHLLRTQNFLMPNTSFKIKLLNETFEKKFNSEPKSGRKRAPKISGIWVIFCSTYWSTHYGILSVCVYWNKKIAIISPNFSSSLSLRSVVSL